MNETVLAALEPTQTMVRLCLAGDGEVEAEVDEMWSFVQSKTQQRWLWWAIDHGTGYVLAYGLADHKDKAFLELWRSPSVLGQIGDEQQHLCAL